MDAFTIFDVINIQKAAETPLARVSSRYIVCYFINLISSKVYNERLKNILKCIEQWIHVSYKEFDNKKTMHSKIIIPGDNVANEERALFLEKKLQDMLIRYKKQDCLIKSLFYDIFDIDYKRDHLKNPKELLEIVIDVIEEPLQTNGNVCNQYWKDIVVEIHKII